MQSATAPSLATAFIAMTRQWMEDTATKLLREQQKTKIFNSTSYDTTNLSKQLEEIEKDIEILTNGTFQSAKNDFIDALRWNTDLKQFTKFVDSSHSFCRTLRTSKFKSYDKIFLYSLWISISFIYFSNYGGNNIKGLKAIYNVLIDINNDIQLRKDLISALRSKMFWTKDEYKLIYSVICFSIRCNLFITKIIDLTCKIYEKSGKRQIAHNLNINDDEKQTESLNKKMNNVGYLKYLNKDWVPTYYNGYYFGKVGDIKNMKLPILSTKDFRKLMKAEKEANKIIIDDLVIHTFDYEIGIFMEKNKEYIHHWYDANNWINLSEEDKFNIFVQVQNNGKTHMMMINSYNTILQIKRKISMKERCHSAAMLTVLWKKQKLQDIHSLFYYNINCNQCLKVSMSSGNPFLDLLK